MQLLTRYSDAFAARVNRGHEGSISLVRQLFLNDLQQQVKSVVTGAVDYRSALEKDAIAAAHEFRAASSSYRSKRMFLAVDACVHRHTCRKHSCLILHKHIF